MVAAVIDKAKERQKLRPRPVTLIHGIRIAPGIGAEAVEQPCYRIVVDINGIGGDQTAVFGKEEEDQRMRTVSWLL